MILEENRETEKLKVPDIKKIGMTLEEAIDVAFRLKDAGILAKEVGINNGNDTTRNREGI